MQRKTMMAVLPSLLLVFLAVASPAFAHDASLNGGTVLGVPLSFEHQDAEPWAGWVNLTVANEGLEAWGGFHFEIFSSRSGLDISTVDWRPDLHAPTSSQSGLTWSVDNLAVGATIDLFFYSDPVLPGQTATFNVYNVNPNQLSFFGISAYPTPVPVPAAAWLLGSGLIGLAGLPRKSS